MTNYKNRGMFLEKVINISNKQYLERGLALINKVPTPTSINTRKGTARYTKRVQSISQAFHKVHL